MQLIFFSDTVLIILFFYIFGAAVSDPEKNNSTIPPDVGPKQRKQMEFYNTRYAIVVKTNLAGIKVQYDWGGGRKEEVTIDKKYVAPGPNMTAS